MGATGSEENIKQIEYTYKNNLPISNENEIYLEMFKQHLLNDVQVIGVIGDYGTGKSSIIEKFISSYKNGEFLKGNTEDKGEKREVITIKIPKFGQGTGVSESINSSGEVRKYLTHQLLSSSYSGSNKELDAIKKKIYAHSNKSVTRWEVFQIVIFVVFIIFMFTNIGNQILFYSKHELLLTSIFWIISASYFSFIGYKLLNTFKLQNYSLISSKQLKFEREKKESYLDYDLDTLTTIINLIDDVVDDLVLIIEDIDRYDNLNILTELSQIIKNTPNVKYVLPVKHSLFESQLEIPKFFDATINVLPINDNLYLYEYIEKTLQENCVEVDVMLVGLTTPFIKDIRMFNSIFNKYISLILNYKNLQQNLTKEQLNQIYTVAVLTVLYPDVVRYQSDTQNTFYDYINKVADINNIRDNLLVDLEDEYNTEKSKLSQATRNLETEKEKYELEIKESSEKIQQMINEMIINNPWKQHEYINIGGKSVYTNSIHHELQSGYRPTVEELQEIQRYKQNDFMWLVDLLEKNEKRQSSLPILKDKVVKAQEELNLTKDLYETKKKEAMSMRFSQLADIAEGDYFSCLESDVLRSEDDYKYGHKKKDVIDLIIELIKGEYLTQSWYRYLSVIDKNADVAQRRKFKYLTLEEKVRYNYDEEEPLVVTQELINTFEIENYSERKFLNKYIVRFLFENIEIDNNSDKLLTIIKSEDKRQESRYYNDIVIEPNQAFKLSEYDMNFAPSEIIQLYEFALESKGVIKIEGRRLSLDGYKMIFVHIIELANIYYKCGVMPSVRVLEIFSACITDYLGEQYKENGVPVEELKLIIAFIEYGYKEIDEDLFGEFFSSLTMYNYRGSTPQIFGVLKDLPELYSPLMNNKTAKVDHSPGRYIVGTQLFEYNEKNLDYIIDELKMVDRVQNRKELRTYLATNINIKYRSLVKKIIEHEKPSDDEAIGEMVKLSNNYGLKFTDISSKFENYQDTIVANNLFEPNEINYKVLLSKSEFEKIGNAYSLNEEYIDSKDYNMIFDYFNDVSDNEALVTFADKAREGMTLNENINVELLKLLNDEDKLAISKDNFDIIKKLSPNLVQKYMSRFVYKDFEMITEKDVIEFNVFKLVGEGDYTLDNKLEFYETYKEIINSDISSEYPIDLNIKILINKETDSFDEFNSKLDSDDKSKLRQGLFRESIKTFYRYYAGSLSFEELSNTILKGYIRNSFTKQEQLRLLLTSNVSKNQLYALIDQFGFNQDILFASSGKGSRTKDIPGYLKEEEGVLNLLKEKCLIKEHDDGKLINFSKEKMKTK